MGSRLYTRTQRESKEICTREGVMMHRMQGIRLSMLPPTWANWILTLKTVILSKRARSSRSLGN